MERVHVLAAVIPPGSVEAELGRLQAGIFSAHGLLSAQALPPLLPLAFLPMGTAPAGLLPSMEKAVAAPWRVRVRGYLWAEGFLYLSVDSGGMWTALRAEALAGCGAEPPGFFPPREGFFLGCGEATDEQRASVHPPASELVFTSAELALFRIETPRVDGQWWRELYWETIDRKPLRGRRKE
jgi:hypothetical protein